MANEIAVETMGVTKVVRDEIPVEVIAIEDGTYTVKNKIDKEFKYRRFVVRSKKNEPVQCGSGSPATQR